MHPLLGYQICIISYTWNNLHTSVYCTKENWHHLMQMLLEGERTLQTKGFGVTGQWTGYLTQAGLCRGSVLTASMLLPPLCKLGPLLSLTSVLKHNAAKHQQCSWFFIDSVPFHHCIYMFRLHFKYVFDRTYTSLWLMWTTKRKAGRSQCDIRFSLILKSWEAEKRHLRKRLLDVTDTALN